MEAFSISSTLLPSSVSPGCRVTPSDDVVNSSVAIQGTRIGGEILVKQVGRVFLSVVKLLRDTADYYDSIYCMSVTVHWWIVYTCIHGMTVCVLTCMLSLMLIGISIHDCIPVE
jgi:hypothetical protein